MFTRIKEKIRTSSEVKNRAKLSELLQRKRELASQKRKELSSTKDQLELLSIEAKYYGQITGVQTQIVNLLGRV